MGRKKTPDTKKPATFVGSGARGRVSIDGYSWRAGIRHLPRFTRDPRRLGNKLSSHSLRDVQRIIRMPVPSACGFS
jgi:hypothetical protein